MLIHCWRLRAGGCRQRFKVPSVRCVWGENICKTTLLKLQVSDPAFITALCTHPHRCCLWDRVAGRELPDFSVLQLGTTLLQLHHHRSFGAFLLLLAFCLPQRRVQDVGFHLQNSARAVPSAAVSYVAANRLLLCISKCQWRGPGSSGDTLCTACQYIFSHFLLKAVFAFYEQSQL